MKKLLILLICLSPILAFAQAPCATITSMSTTSTSCFGSADGSITVMATAIATPITYSIGSTTNSTGVFSGLTMGPYIVNAIDANNCVDSQVVFVTSPTPLSIGNVTTTTPSCVPGNDGSFCLTATGGTPAYIYTLAPLVSQNTFGCFNNLGSGVYTASVTDMNGCTANTTVTLASPPPLVLTMFPMFNSNPCDPDTIHVIASGGSQPVTYNLMPGNINSPNGSFILPTGGTYTITATDGNNCTVSTSVALNTNAPQSVSSQFVNPNCGSTNGSITANVVWPSTTFNYILNPGNISNTTGIYNNLGPGIYTVTAQGPSCSFVVDTFVLQSKLTPYPVSATQNTFTASVPTNGTAPYVYTLNSQVIPNPFSGLRCTGVDTFRITDAGGCTFDTTFSFIAGNSFPGVALNKNITDASCALSNNGQIIYAPSSTLTYDWMANNAVQGSTANPLSGLSADVYVVKLHNAAGDCIQDTSTVGAIGTNCGDIAGKAFYDNLNTNCTLDTLEAPFPNVTVTLMPGNIQAITNANGDYQFTGLPYGNYVVEVDTNAILGQYPSCNLIQYDTITSSNNSHTNNFPFGAVVNVDLYTNTYNTNLVTASPAMSFGRDHRIYYGYYGFTSTQVNANLYVLMDSIHHYDTASLAPTAIMGDTLMWTINNLSGWNMLTMYYDSIQNLPLNHIIPVKAWISAITPLIGNNLSNDTSNANLIIATSYDPNDKQVSPQGDGPQGYIDPTDMELSYRVRFQNTGTAMAYNVAIEDTISNLLDINSLQVLGASHNYLIEKDNNLIRFKFNNIMLPDSNADEPNSHGFIQYTIQQDAGNIPGDIINNTAHIYFDFNPAVVTNTTINTIRFPISVENINTTNFKVYPNPTQDQLHIQGLTQKVNTIHIYDLIGREMNLNVMKKNDKLVSISLGNLPTGIYLLSVNNETFKVSKQ